MTAFEKHIQDLKAKGRYRSLSLARGIDLTSNDYLGIAADNLLRPYALEYLQNDGDIGAAGSRLLRGHCAEHAALETAAATFFAAPKTLYMASGFQANATLFQTLPNRHDAIIYDEFVHASAREGIQNSHAKTFKAQHNNAQSFEDACKRATKSVKGRLWIAVESLYSMDGDIAPLEDLFKIAAQYDAILIIDEAHASGALGDSGRGLAYDIYSHISGHTSGDRHFFKKGACPLLWNNIITLHTCGKSFGVAGAIMCASEDVIDMMINKARGFIYSTAPMPMQAYLVQKALEIVSGKDGQKRRAHLNVLSRQAQKIFGGPGTYIIPLILGDDRAAQNAAHQLQQKGWDIRAIRPPTVPEGTARLRLSLSASLSEEQLENFARDYQIIIDGDH